MCQAPCGAWCESIACGSKNGSWHDYADVLLEQQHDWQAEERLSAGYESSKIGVDHRQLLLLGYTTWPGNQLS